jgi:hypothetical protein
MTNGYRVTITKPAPGGRGQTPQYFPHLDDRDGWSTTSEASDESLDAQEFRRAYDDLMACLEACLPWRSRLRTYRERHKRQQHTGYLIREAAEKIA